MKKLNGKIDPTEEAMFRGSEEAGARLRAFLDRCFDKPEAEGLIAAGEKVAEKNSRKEKLTTEDYAVIDRMADFCQRKAHGGMGGNEKRVNEVLTVLWRIYEPLIQGTVRGFCSKRELSDQHEDWEQHAWSCFQKLVVGDSPKIIAAYQNDEPGLKGRSLEMVESLNDKRIPTMKRYTEEDREKWLATLKENGLDDKELEQAAWIFEENLKSFPEWINSRPPVGFKQWVRENLEHHKELLRRIPERRPERREECEMWLDICNDALRDIDNYLSDKKVRAWWSDAHEAYKKKAVRDFKYKYDGAKWRNFTTFLATCLPRALNDIYKSAAHKRSTGTGREVPSSEFLERQPASFGREEQAERLLDDPRIIRALTPKQKTILRMVSERYKQKEIAEETGVSEARVSAQWKSIKEKAVKALSRQ